MKRRIAITLRFGACSAWLLVMSCAALAQPPADSPGDPARESYRSVRIRYAQTSLELAKLDLALYQEANRRVSNTYTAAEVDRQKNSVRLAEQQLHIAQQQDPQQSDFVALQVLRAEHEAQKAKRAYSEALESKRVDPAYSELKLKRLELQAEKAQLRLAMWKDPTTTPVDHVHWELDRLSEEVFALRKQFEDLLDQIGSQ